MLHPVAQRTQRKCQVASPIFRVQDPGAAAVDQFQYAGHSSLCPFSRNMKGTYFNHSVLHVTATRAAEALCCDNVSNYRSGSEGPRLCGRRLLFGRTATGSAESLVDPNVEQEGTG